MAVDHHYGLIMNWVYHFWPQNPKTDGVKNDSKDTKSAKNFSQKEELRGIYLNIILSFRTCSLWVALIKWQKPTFRTCSWEWEVTVITKTIQSICVYKKLCSTCDMYTHKMIWFLLDGIVFIEARKSPFIFHKYK